MNNVFYGTYISQPCRTIAFFMDYLDIDFEFFHIDFNKNFDILSKLNPQKKIPVIKYDNVVMYETPSIIRFLSKKIKNDLYPIDDRETIYKIEEYFQIHQRLFRKLNTMFYVKLIEDLYKIYEEITTNILNFIERNLLKNEYWINNKLTIADILLANEIIQLNLVNFKMDNYPKILNFLNRIAKWKNFSKYLSRNFRALKKFNYKNYINLN